MENFWNTVGATVPSGGTPNGLLTDLVSYYKADTSGSFPDTHGSNDGTISGANYTASGKINGAYSFDGVNDNISITNNATLRPVGSFSVSGFFKATSSATRRGFFQSYSQNGAVSGIQLMQTQNTGEGGNESKFRFVVGANTGFIKGIQYEEAFSSGTIIDGAWHQYVCVYNGTTLQVFIDGVGGTAVNYSAGIGYKASNYIRIGCNNNNGTDIQFYNSILDEVSFWDKALTQTEITDLYNSGAGLSYDSFTT